MGSRGPDGWVGGERGVGSSERAVALVLVHPSPPWYLCQVCLEAGGPGPWPQERFLRLSGRPGLGRAAPHLLPPPS